MRPVLFLVLLCSFTTGCTSMALERNTDGQFRTVHSLYEQQVLDNLAMFVHDPGSLPYFNVLSTGANQVVDQGSISSVLTLARVLEGARQLFMVSSNATTVGLQRSSQENWTANPVTDPRRLELMQCAYRKEVAANMGHAEHGGECPNCKTRWEIFYGTTDKDTVDPYGRVTNLCLGMNTAWFGWGCKHDVPKSCDCTPVGHYCGTYVWILPGGQEEFSKLTLAILDYAINQPSILTKQITYNIARDGTAIEIAKSGGSNGAAAPGDKKDGPPPPPVPPAPKTASAGTVTVVVPYTTPNVLVLDAANNATGAHQTYLDQNRGRTTSPTEIPTLHTPFQNTQPPDFQFLNQRLQLLNPPAMVSP
jgi:hypothetical protein